MCAETEQRRAEQDAYDGEHDRELGKREAATSASHGFASTTTMRSLKAEFTARCSKFRSRSALAPSRKSASAPFGRGLPSRLRPARIRMARCLPAGTRFATCRQLLHERGGAALAAWLGVSA